MWLHPSVSNSVARTVVNCLTEEAQGPSSIHMWPSPLGRTPWCLVAEAVWPWIDLKGRKGSSIVLARLKLWKQEGAGPLAGRTEGASEGTVWSPGGSQRKRYGMSRFETWMPLPRVGSLRVNMYGRGRWWKESTCKIKQAHAPTPDIIQHYVYVDLWGG